MHTTPLTSRRARAALLAAGALALGLPAAASADCIVYIDHGNVWSASPDGAKKVQITKGGGWHSPTQSDDGTIAAVKGLGFIHLIQRDVREISTISFAGSRRSARRSGGVATSRASRSPDSPGRSSP